MSYKQGILLIAAGHANYGRMAAVLAASLKAATPEVQIHLSHTDSAVLGLTGGEWKLFDSHAVIPEEYYTNKGKIEYIRTKMYMYNLSPFKETIFLDSDMVWLSRSPNDLFEQFAEVDLTFSNDGYYNHYSQWADVEEIKKVYKVDKLLSIHSEFYYFKKKDEVRKFFTQAQNIYNNLKVKATVFAGAIPDELPFFITCALNDITPHKMPFLPVYWFVREKRRMHTYQKAAQWYAMSMGGSYANQYEVTDYNNLAMAAYHKMGLQHPYQWKNKSSFLAERK